MDVGVVESATLTDDLTHVEIKARLNSGMQKLLHNDSVFWVVKPQVGREGISGLGTLLSGAYIELQPGSKGSVPAQYPLLDSPPLASPDAKDPDFAGKQQGRPAVARRPGAVPRLSRGVGGNQHL